MSPGVCGKQEPENNFLPDRQIRDILTVFSIREVLAPIRLVNRPLGLVLPAVREMPRSLDDLEPWYFSPKVLRIYNLMAFVILSDEETTAPLSDNLRSNFRTDNFLKSRKANINPLINTLIFSCAVPWAQSST